MCRQEAPMISALADRHFVAPTAHDMAAREVASKLAEFYAVLERSPMFMTDAQVAELFRICVSFGTGYQRLRNMCADEGRLCWPVRPKTHKMQHFPMFVAIINPRFVGCYADESLIGSVGKVWQRSVAGRWHAQSQRKVLAKRSLSIWLRFELQR